MADLDPIAADLYALPPAEFTAARNERAKSVGGAVGAAVKALAKPSAAAWATNLLARAKPDELAQLFTLGDALREAQDGADRATLTTLGSQRRALVAALAKEAAALAEEAGHALNAAAVTDIQGTLNAGMADAGAAAAVSSARLVRALAGDGLDAVDLADAVGGSLPEMRAKAAPKKPTRKAAEAARRARAEAEARLKEATAAADAAEKAATDAARRREALVAERDELRERLADVETELGGATRALDEADRAGTTATRDRDRAEQALDAG